MLASHSDAERRLNSLELSTLPQAVTPGARFDDKNNALVNFAVKNSSSVAAMLGDINSDAEKLAIWERAKQGAVYTLDDTVLTNSRDRVRRAVTCSGLLYVKVGDTIAQKEVEYKVEQTADGKMLVSVNPFLF